MRARAQTAAIVLTAAAACLAAPAASVAARLVGGREQAAIVSAFDARRSHRGDAVVSVRASSASPAWAVVRFVAPEAGGRTTAHGATPRLQSAYYHRVGRAERGGTPPRSVRADLNRALDVAVVYRGSGAESITYGAAYKSDCAGQGGFTEIETVSVTPMSWRVRYVVDLDDLLAAVHSADGTVLVPAVTFDAGASSIDASETISRTVQDAGCNGNPTTLHCTEAFRLGGADPAGDLTFSPADGTEIAVPMTDSTSGGCAPANFTLGPALWDAGGATALVSRLGLLGGRLPANPYAPIRVTWPGDSAAQTQGFTASPCQGDGSACTDLFQWSGTVSLQTVS
ncbi:MAG TPA: hypothetical protein VHX62_19025 [Solirubrobacteraceae bacterium]|jgi:hypothetical protein|nr:hypothetical protein [Solirubrobacteraceae bacterium]